MPQPLEGQQTKKPDMADSTKKIKRTPPPELPWSWHKSLGYRGQFSRVRRWYRRLSTATALDDIEDFLYAFFQNCYHLREWLLDAKVVAQTELESLFADNVEMQLCQDICNATKHQSLSTPRRPREFSLAREYVGPKRGWFEDDSILVVLSEGHKYDAIDLARSCLSLWEEFFKQHNLDRDV